MQATTTQLALTIIIMLGILTTSVAVYFSSIKHGRSWFLSYVMMLIIVVQWMSDIGSSLSYQNYYLHLSSVIIFPSIIFSLFIVHILQGVKSSRQMLTILLAGNLGYVAIIIALWSLGNTPGYLELTWSWARNHLFSALAILADYLILLMSWPIIHNQRFKLPLAIKIWIICWLMLTTDSVIFTLGTFWGNPLMMGIINANLMIRTILSILVTPIITIYVKSFITNNENSLKYHKWDEIIKNPEDQIILQQSLEKVSKLEKLEKELTFKNKELDNQRIAIANVLEDVQQEKNIVMQQADELRRFKAASEQSNEMIVFADKEGIVQWGNKATETITGFSIEESSGRKAGILWGKLMPKEWYANLWKTVKKDKQTFVSEIQNHRKNGERFWSTLTIYPLLNNDGEVQFLVATQRDITHEKAVDAMKTDFISLASHQLRTPLSAMKWFLEMLTTGDLGKLSQEQLEAITNVEQSNERMIALVNGLLNISRIESGRIIIDPEPTDLLKITEDVKAELIEKFKSKNQEVIISANQKIPKILLDIKLIRQVLINLLTNANKYTRDGGEITVFISRKNEEIVVQVSDNGYGIPTTEQDKIFSRFFRASNIVKEETDGTGLGLYLAKAIIESSGGKIWFKSTEGQGTSFWFTLPIIGMKAKAGEVRLS